jgi:hypothetical protein
LLFQKQLIGDNPVKNKKTRRQPWVKIINGRQPSKKQGDNLGLKIINMRQPDKKQEILGEKRKLWAMPSQGGRKHR